MYNLTDLKKKGFEIFFVFTVNRDMEYMYTSTNQFKKKKCPCNPLLLG